ncbi:MAG: 3-deoxy-7-phosphoheptulonate synthase [Thermoflexus sp.]|uniref:3-deoxy-7-phosphoheptulonate synthase n=1 Tax=Thermoflexus sp. TaxID=1969742 RepID=UPI0025ED8977|nr:3-deoxy-7-phosphoheptulonate synthase [Thermoflexus sp.]MCS6965136.1 3-deoxy-7-phosphoheptulonate synthase [Thermoflexus sp.]MDW8184644.1 3-deoxy-7-phosphoheptulonate synthase [Anaerolineae bacterium]
MIIVMKHGATPQQIANVVAQIEGMGFRAHLSQGVERTIIGIIGDERPLNPDQILFWEGVERVVPILRPFKLASRDFQPEDTTVNVNGVVIGGTKVVVIAGPCAVEGREQLLEAAHAVKAAGASMLRGGAFKPRTSPYSFQGLGVEGLRLLAEAREQTGLPVVTEVMAPEHVPIVAEYADVLQIGARNMQNFALLEAVGKARKPVLLKRGLMSTVEELLLAAEYILLQGNHQVILCERGIRTFEPYTRNTLDINAIPLLKQLTHLPVIVDPSHGTGRWNLVPAVSRAAVAAGADGLIIEVHPRPEAALSDGAQSLKPDRFAALMEELRRVAEAVGRTL